MTPTDTPIDPLAERFESHRVEERLHDVPPHEVLAVVVEGRRAVFKRDRGPTGRAGVEGRVLSLVGETTDLPVPTVLAVGPDWFLAAAHPAAPTPETVAEPDERWARVAGRGLARLHEGTAPAMAGYGSLAVGADGGLARPTEPDWHAAALERVRERRATLERYGHAEAADRVLAWLEEHPAAFAGAGEPVCCHGWWAPEHVPVREGAVRCVLDLEHAVAAPGE